MNSNYPFLLVFSLDQSFGCLIDRLVVIWWSLQNWNGYPCCMYVRVSLIACLALEFLIDSGEFNILKWIVVWWLLQTHLCPNLLARILHTNTKEPWRCVYDIACPLTPAPASYRALNRYRHWLVPACPLSTRHLHKRPPAVDELSSCHLFAYILARDYICIRAHDQKSVSPDEKVTNDKIRMSLQITDSQRTYLYRLVLHYPVELQMKFDFSKTKYYWMIPSWTNSFTKR